MLSQMKWTRIVPAVLMALALLSGGLVWAKKPVPPPDPEPDPPPVTYTVTWLDTFATSEANGVNSLGHVVGPATSPERYDGEEFAYVYTPGTGMVDLNTLLPEASGWRLWTAYDINDRGQIVGEGYLAGVETRLAYRYTPALLAEDGSELLPAIVEALGPLHLDDQRTSPRGINEHGEVCGFSNDASGQYHVWFYSDDVGMVTVLSATDGSWLWTRSINESGQILVSVIPVESPQSVIRVFPFEVPEYFYPEYGDYLEVSDMNDNGHFVGFSSFEKVINKNRSTFEIRAARHDGITLWDLGAGARSGANGINNHGDVVGSMDSDGFVYLEAFQQLVNLDAAVVGDDMDLSLWLHEKSTKKAQRINDAGQIAGDLSNYDVLGFGLHAFVLTPIPTAD